MKSLKTIVVAFLVFTVALTPSSPVYGLTGGNDGHRIPSDLSQRCPQFEQAFRRYGLLPVSTFSYISWREARCRIKATNIRRDRQGRPIWTLNANGTYDSGLLQINSSWRTVTRQVCGGDLDKLLELDCNLRVGKYLLEHGGLSHWSLG